MKKKNLISEVRQLQKIAGLLKEEDLDTSINPLSQNYKKGKFQRGETVAFGFEGEPRRLGIIDKIAKSYDQAKLKGADLRDWDELFNDEEAAMDYGYESFEDWVSDYVSRQKNSTWYEVQTKKGSDGWFPEEYVEDAVGF